MEIFTLEEKQFKNFFSRDYTENSVNSKLLTGIEIDLKKICI
jgi:hypothetical protein